MSSVERKTFVSKLCSSFTLTTIGVVRYCDIFCDLSREIHSYKIINMKIFKIELTVIILIYVIVITMSADLEINRKRPTGKNGWKIGKDSFKISPYFCNQDVDCNSFAGAKVKSQSDHCSCLCSSSSATFMFHNHEWGCQRKENVRILLGE